MLIHVTTSGLYLHSENSSRPQRALRRLSLTLQVLIFLQEDSCVVVYQQPGKKRPCDNKKKLKVNVLCIREGIDVSWGMRRQAHEKPQEHQWAAAAFVSLWLIQSITCVGPMKEDPHLTRRILRCIWQSASPCEVLRFGHCCSFVHVSVFCVKWKCDMYTLHAPGS